MGVSGKGTRLVPDESSYRKIVPEREGRERDRRDFYTRDAKGAEEEAVL